MNTKKSIMGITLAIIMIASIFAVLPFAAVVQAQPPLPPRENDNPLLNESLLTNDPYGASLRVYGEDDMGPVVGYVSKGQFVYPNWWDPFDPAALEKDVLTFNPGVFRYEDGYPSSYRQTITSSTTNAHTKKFLRLWYEPDHVYTKSIYHYPTIEVESTYMLIQRQDWIPVHGIANYTHFVFPIAERANQTGLGAVENAGMATARANVVTLSYVSGAVPTAYNKTTNGTIRIQKDYTALEYNDEVQFLDHKLQYKWLTRDPEDGKIYAMCVVKYAGNIEDDSATWVTLGKAPGSSGPTAITWFDRHNNIYNTYNHAEHRTWFARFVSGPGANNSAYITVGKQIAAGDTFYVNAVRYDVPAIEVLDVTGDTVAEAFKYITVKTPLPKKEGSVVQSLLVNRSGVLQLPDDNKTSSQWIDPIEPYEVIPVNPPFNDPYMMIDDINIVLWEPNDNTDEWPIGDPSGEIGTEYWPWAERYLTMQEEEIEKEVWCANNMTVGENWMDYFDVEEGDWVTDIDAARLRCLGPVSALRFCYVEEDYEPRYTTDLYERLKEEFELDPNGPPVELWDTTSVRTLPDDYTEFALQMRPDLDMSPYWTKTGDYLLTTSFLAPNSYNRSDILRSPPAPAGVPKATFAFDVQNEDDVLDLTDPMGNGLDIYVNRYTNISSAVRIYGEKDIGPLGVYGANGTFYYTDYSDPFNPAAIRKDSITFNPAIIQHDDIPSSGYNPFMIPAGFNAEVKKYLRMWYEPEHVYSKPTIKAPTIEVESTYLLIDRQDKMPASSKAGMTHFAFPIAADLATGYPKVGLELFENEEGTPTRENLVTVAYINGSVALWNKTTQGTIRLEKTYTLEKGETVQFLSFSLNYWQIMGNQSQVIISYMGNDEPEDVYTGALLGTDTNPKARTWFDREGNGLWNDSYHPNARWYAQLVSYAANPLGDTAMITVGMELRAGETFYVDGVRYDIVAIEVIDGNGNATDGAELFKYITLKTPLPKDDGIFVENDGDTGGHGWIWDDGTPWWSSQRIWTYPPETILPVNPPFDKDDHDIVDDIGHALSSSVAGRIIEGYPALEVFYVTEAIEPRYSTNLLEILDEYITGTDLVLESWTKYDIITRPDQYTEFVLPGDETRYNFETRTWEQALHDDYLITTSFLAPNANESSELRDLSYDLPRAAFVFDVFNTKGIYINEIEAAQGPPGPPPGGEPTPTCNITPSGDVSSATWITATVNATSWKFPLTVKVYWDDGAQSVGTLVDETDVFVAQHQYLVQDEYTVTTDVTDIYGNTGTCTCGVVNVTSDGFKLVLRPGWNAISIPVNDSLTVDDIFDPTNNTWFSGAWRWDAAGSSWESMSPGDTVPPEMGLMVLGPPSGTVEIIVTGTAASFTSSGWLPGKWNLVGPGFNQVTVPQWVYYWNQLIYGYDVGHTMDPGRSYWVKP